MNCNESVGKKEDGIMRCAVEFDENKPLCDQEIKAWGEMQSLEEEPGYRESDIKDEREQEFFRGYKFAFDTVCTILDNLTDEIHEELTQEQSEEIQRWMNGELCEVLFSILDNQACDEE